ncbi:hypothetical protein KDA23_05840 [Candidatus Saccharibacteria bacterium]|nr:hypothetical protein [Candidatus Saccharibacteria bacterium]
MFSGARLIRRTRKTATAAIVALMLISASLFTVIQPTTVNAASCDKVNIVYCGLNGNNAQGYLDSFQHFYNTGSSNGHHDLRAVYRWAGATYSKVAAMNSTNTKVGTLYRNGDLEVNGQVVATDAWVSARFGAGQAGFTQILPGVWARKTTTSFANASVPTLVHFNQSGNVDFAVMIDCGNAVKVTPKPQPKPVISCLSLVANPTDQRLTYEFVARANAKRTSIVSYSFSFNDGKTKVVKTHKEMLSVKHTFTEYNTRYRVTVVVNGKHGSDRCKTTVTTPTKPVKECLPGIPVGDARCTPTPPKQPPTPPITPQTQELSDTGMGMMSVVGLFGSTVSAAAFGHRYLSRRRLGI